jgi:hypothetical protein
VVRRSPALAGAVWWIAFSAFFADLGYQMVLTGLPVFLVVGLGAPAWVLGLAMAISYGPGAVLGWVGGRLGDRWGRKRVAVGGNLAIPLLSLSGLAATPAAAVGLFSLGWWARNFRTPARRAMLIEVTAPSERARAFGILHALDVGGGLLAALAVIALTAAGMPLGRVFLLTVLPLLASTACLLPVQAGGRPEAPAARPPAPPAGSPPAAQPLYRGVLVAAALYGFSSYSLGFPILTVTQGTGQRTLGFAAYALFLGVSALTGLWAGRRPGGVGMLAGLGYGLAAAGSLALALDAAMRGGAVSYLGAIAALGVALGVIETWEPALIARLVSDEAMGRGMGSLTAARSLGLFVGNGLMGLLYQVGAGASYGYAALVAAAAAVILLMAGRQSRVRQ